MCCVGLKRHDGNFTPWPVRGNAKSTKKLQLMLSRGAGHGGLKPIRDAKIQYSVQYYLFAIAFVIFDVEVLFLYPWIYVYANEAMQKFLVFGSMNIAVFEMLLFIIVLLVGLIYAIKKEALRWV